MASLPSGTVTFLFTDIEGSTARWEQQPEAMRVALARHDALLRAVILENDGRVVKTMGDAFHAAFSRAPDALAAALDAQRRLLAEPWGETGPLRVRMALHTGVAEERDGDYYGPTLNRAARLLTAGHGGQVLLSEVTAGLSREALPLGASLTDLGEHRLKDLGQSERAFQLVHPDIESAFPPLRSLDRLPNNLPRQLTSFVGREREVDEVKRLLAATSLLTLVGTGGAGKTRLSLQVAADAIDEHRDGVWLVELAPTSDPVLVAQAVASAIGIREQAGRPALVTLQEYLRERTLLLVLDNCEHLVAACATLADALLRACPGLKILATSREALGIAGETTWRVPSLALPDPSVLALANAQNASVLTQFEAVRLFIERALTVDPAFRVTNRNAPAVAQICHRLDGMPLAIELAAARIRVLPPEQIAARLDDRFHFLTGGSRTALPRQQTLRALVDWSYDLLAEPERAMLQRLSVFAGDWTLEAAEAICSGAGIDAADVLDLLTQLVDKSIVIADVRGEMTRYRLLETLRQYGAERLAASGDAERVGRAHRDWFLDLAERAVIDFWGPRLSTWIKLLHTEHDNLRAALGWTLARHDDENVEVGLRLTSALGPFWWVDGHLNEGVPLLRRALGVDGSGTRPPDAGASLPVPEGPLRHFMGAHPRVAALNMLATCENTQQAFVQVAEHTAEARAIAERAHDSVGVANAVIIAGLSLKDEHQLLESAAMAEEGVQLARLAGHRWSIWRALASFAETLYALGDYGRARQLLQESMPIAQSIGLTYGVAQDRRKLGVIAHLQGDLEGAEAALDSALSMYRDLGATRGLDEGLQQLGSVLLARGEYVRAAASFAESLRLCLGTGRHRGVVLNFEGLAGVAAAGPDVAAHRLTRTARLLGAAARHREAHDVLPQLMERQMVEPAEAAARAGLGDDGFASAWAEGHAMTFEQVVAYALDKTDRA